MNLGFLDLDTAITAAGTTQAGAQLLIKGGNVVTTVAASSGVRLQEALGGTAGAPQLVYNGGANPLKVYPPVGYQINTLGTNTPAVLPVGSTALFWTISTTQIIGGFLAS